MLQHCAAGPARFPGCPAFLLSPSCPLQCGRQCGSAAACEKSCRAQESVRGCKGCDNSPHSTVAASLAAARFQHGPLRCCFGTAPCPPGQRTGQKKCLALPFARVLCGEVQ